MAIPTALWCGKCQSFQEIAIRQNVTPAAVCGGCGTPKSQMATAVPDTDGWKAWSMEECLTWLQSESDQSLVRYAEGRNEYGDTFVGDPIEQAIQENQDERFYLWQIRRYVNYLLRRLAVADAELERCVKILNTPQYDDWIESVKTEAQHQDWSGRASDDGDKWPAEWFGLVCHLAEKCVQAQTRGDWTKALHHTISTAAVLMHWHGEIKSTMETGE